MFDLTAAADVDDPRSLANRLRNARFRVFESLVEALPKPIRIIDIGGTENFWVQRGWAGRPDIDITAVNHDAMPQTHANVRTLKGDATDLSEFGPKAFDVAFSNSVIEHLFTEANQRRMATEVKRVAKAYWVQTPNFWFPMEPHFLMPGWQWLPRSVRIAVIQRRRCGWRGPCPDPVAARQAVDEVRLLTRAELLELFGGGSIWAEKLFGLTKSIVAYGGFSTAVGRGSAVAS